MMTMTVSTIMTVPSQMSPLSYKKKRQPKPRIYLRELFWGPNGRFLNFHQECNFLDNPK